LKDKAVSPSSNFSSLKGEKEISFLKRFSVRFRSQSARINSFSSNTDAIPPADDKKER
jgi:hypothetical protein